MQMLQSTLLSYCARTVCEDIPFWFMLTQPTTSLRTRAESIVQQAGHGEVVALDALVGAGSAPGTTVESCGIALTGDHRETLRGRALPVIARAVNGTTFIDLRSVHPNDDALIVEALQQLA
jgi:L-seryl-tRNA(Ser) seleniumtransferase